MLRTAWLNLLGFFIFASRPRINECTGPLLQRSLLNALILQAEKIASTYSLNIDDFEKLCKLLRHMESMQKSADFDIFKKMVPRSKDAALAYERWCIEECHMTGLKLIDQNAYGWGLSANHQIPAGTALFNISLAVTLYCGDTFEMVASKIFSVPANAKMQFMWTDMSCLALRILSTRLGSNSYWQEYIDFLPTSMPFLLFFSPEEVRHLWGSRTYQTTIWGIQESVREYAQIFKHLQENTDLCQKYNLCTASFTYTLYRWALAIAMTRSHEIPGFKQSLIPCYDMPNHGVSNLHSAINHGTLLVTAKVDLAEKSGIFHEYSDLSTPVEVFYAQWGFTPTDRPLLLEVTLRDGMTLKRLKLTKLRLAKIPLRHNFGLQPVGSNNSEKFKEPKAWKFLCIFFGGRTVKQVKKKKHYATIWKQFYRYVHWFQSRYAHNLHNARTILQKTPVVSDNMYLALNQIIVEQSILDYARATAVGNIFKLQRRF